MTTQTLTVPSNNFSVISGSISGLADNSIYANVARVRAAMTSPLPGVASASYYFKILGSSPTVAPDSDGVTRQGVVFWVNMQNACNLYFLFWRTDSTQPAGTTIVGAKVQVNPAITSQTVNNSDLIACAGVGYSTLSQPDGTSADTSSNINMMDGNWHNFTIVKVGPERWRLYTDSVFVFEAYDPANNFPVDSNLWGLRLDNVQIQLYYRLAINTTQQFSTSFAIAPPTGLVGQSISFSASASGGSQPYTYSWNFGDGVGTSNLQSPTYSYSSPGSYTVILTTTDYLGETTTSSNTLNVSGGSTAPSQPPTQPPSNPSSGPTCILCDTSRLVSTLSLLTIGLFAGGFLSVGIFLSKYHAENRRLAAELRSHYQMNRTTPSLRVWQTKTTRRRINREYRTL
jgi:PKD repeat protein